jgi:ribonuclease BN (tRNA processing enzyme)
MSLQLTVLGCSGSYPGPGDAASGYLLRGGGTNVVVDLGPGSLANLQQHLALEAIDAVILTHRHPDHWTDLTGLHTALKYGSDRQGLQVWGTPEGRQLAEELTGGLAPTIEWRDIADGSLLVVNGLCFTFGPTVHYVPTFAVRVDGPAGELLVYSADTGPDWPITALTTESPVFAGRPEAERRIDLLLCESTHVASREGEGVLHLSGRQAGVLARSVGARRLLLTHLWPTDDPEDHRAEAIEAFGAPVELAVTNQTYDIGRTPT